MLGTSCQIASGDNGELNTSTGLELPLLGKDARSYSELPKVAGVSPLAIDVLPLSPCSFTDIYYHDLMSTTTPQFAQPPGVFVR